MPSLPVILGVAGPENVDVVDTPDEVHIPVSLEIERIHEDSVHRDGVLVLFSAKFPDEFEKAAHIVLLFQNINYYEQSG